MKITNTGHSCCIGLWSFPGRLKQVIFHFCIGFAIGWVCADMMVYIARAYAHQRIKYGAYVKPYGQRTFAQVSPDKLPAGAAWEVPGLLMGIGVVGLRGVLFSKYRKY